MFYSIMRFPISPPNWFDTVSLNWELISPQKKKIGNSNSKPYYFPASAEQQNSSEWLTQTQNQPGWTG